MIKQIVLFCALLLSFSIYSQQDSIKRVELDTVILQSSRIAEKSIRLPIAISQLDFKNSQDSRQQLSFNEYLQGAPGVFALNANNFSQDLRVSIRGFGARSAFGIRGVKIIVDGIPETTPDGQGQIDNLNLSIIKNIEVIRGPSSTLYGNASGGVISINTIDDFDENFGKVGLTFASYNMQQYQATIGLKGKQVNYIFQGSRVNTDGFRQQSGFENYNFNLRMLRQFSTSSKLNFQFNYTDSPFAEDAGGLTIDEVIANRRQARQRNVDFKTKETIRQFKIGTNFEHKWNSFIFNTYGFYATRDFYGLLPFKFGGIVDLNRNYFGNGSSLTFVQKLNNGQNKLQIGYDFATQDDKRLRFENLEGFQGNNTFNQKESFSSIGIFALDHFSFNNFLIRVGIRYDRNILKVKDRFFSNGDDSGQISLNSINPSLSFNYKVNMKNYIYAGFSTSFETPTLSELSSNPSGEGGFNINIKAQKAFNYELGYKLKHKNRQAEIALFYIKTDNDLVPFELEAFPDRTFFLNAGSTNRKGIELSYTQRISNTMKFSGNYSYSNFKYTSYETTSGNFAGNYLPGIPKHLLGASIEYRNKKGFNIRLYNQYVGSLFVNDDNTIEDNNYDVFNANLAYKFELTNFSLSPFLGINNVFDSRYNDNIRINAFGGRYYEPAPGANIFGGLRFAFH